MLRHAGPGLVLALLLAACGGSSGTGTKTVTVGGEQVTVARLVDAHAGLCEGAGSPATARALFFDRSHAAVHTVARGVEDVDRAQAAALLEAKEKVEAELDNPPPTLSADLLHLADVYRISLGRLAITAPPCQK